MTEITSDFRSGIVALIGPPNAGKSTLLNQIIGEKVAIVSPKPQTTRNQITGILTREDVQIVFLDTPGIHQRKGKLNSFLLKSAWDGLASADVIVFLLDGHLYLQKPQLMERELVPLAERLKKVRNPLFIAVNKVDRVKDKKLLLPLSARLNELMPDVEIFFISARNGDGVQELLAKIIPVLPYGPPLYPEDQISTLPLRFMAAEIIREKLFLSLHKELPYNLAVQVEHWEETETLVKIMATIYVSRSSHKPIVIGHRGQLLKKVGQEARVEIEEIVGKKVYLELWVKIKPKWTENTSFLFSLGLG
ncbi:GTPase Era [Desulfohalobiaceae bacterium Ax17]|jgi:GTP-binding protein Era|uniref:GTPase Era n=1 Tax=Desulfovulcanus ferrireducens TaxID=2831190 RepID=UPI00207B99C1|nr:GTPase Era [Desulfovulcanus ferrireducens]MBT8763645.1 GTPase Era [Desulfovulcanus ferrireducens]